MKKTKRFFVAALSVVLVAGALTGCGEKKAMNNDEKPELKILMAYMKEDPNTYPVAKDIEEATGYHVKYYTLPQDKPEEKLNLIMASSEPYDIIITTNNLRINWSDYAKKGALLQLDELVDKYGKNMKSVMKKESFDLMRMENKLYGIPVPKIKIGNALNFTSMMVTNSDVMKKINAESPKTVDEFTELLRKMKNDAGLIPLCTKQAIDLPGLVGAFGVPNAWNESNGELLNRAEDPRYIEYIKYLRELYKEGLLDNEFPTNRSATLSEKFAGGLAGIIPIAYSEAGALKSALERNNPDASLYFIDPVKGKNGDIGIGTGDTSLDKIVFIPKSAEHPEEAVKYMDLLLEEENFKLLTIGRENEHYKVENGEYFPIAPKFFDERGSASNYLTGINETTYPKYWQSRVRKDQAVYDAYKYMALDDERLQYAVANPALDPPVFDSDRYVKTINQMANDYFVKVVAGEEDLDKSYPEFLKKWKAEGGAEVSKNLNEWYKSKSKK